VRVPFQVPSFPFFPTQRCSVPLLSVDLTVSMTTTSENQMTAPPERIELMVQLGTRELQRLGLPPLSADTLRAESRRNPYHEMAFLRSIHRLAAQRATGQPIAQRSLSRREIALLTPPETLQRDHNHITLPLYFFFFFFFFFFSLCCFL
jgi:hypothetical protein